MITALRRHRRRPDPRAHRADDGRAAPRCRRDQRRRARPGAGADEGRDADGARKPLGARRTARAHAPGLGPGARTSTRSIAKIDAVTPERLRAFGERLVAARRSGGGAARAGRRTRPIARRSRGGWRPEATSGAELPPRAFRRSRPSGSSCGCPRWATMPRGRSCAASGESFLRPWEPTWSQDHLTRRAFRNRVYWAWRARDEGRALPLFLIRREDRRLMGAITLDNIRRGPAQTAQVGYWIGPDFARQGLMTRGAGGGRPSCLRQLDLSRIEAACLPENAASRALLDRTGFRHEGVARKLSADRRALARPRALRQPEEGPPRPRRRLTTEDRRSCLTTLPDPRRCGLPTPPCSTG